MLKRIESSGTLRISVSKIQRFKPLERYDVLHCSPNYIAQRYCTAVVHDKLSACLFV